MRSRRTVKTTIVRSSGTSGRFYHQLWLWAIFLAIVALLFTIIAIAAPGWNGLSLIKNYGNSRLSTIVLTFLAIFCLFLGILVTILFARNLITSFSNGVKISVIFLYAIAGIFIVAAYASFTDHNSKYYSYYLMITSGVLTFVAGMLVAFWLGRNFASI